MKYMHLEFNNNNLFDDCFRMNLLFIYQYTLSNATCNNRQWNY